MANTCWFEMKVCGTKKNVEDFLKITSFENCENIDTPKLNFGCKCHDKQGDDENYTMYLMGESRNSMNSSVSPESDKEKSVVELSKELDLSIEIFSRAPDMCFQEHFVIKNGEIIENVTVEWSIDTVEYLEADDDYFETYLESDLAKAAGITRENYRTFADDDGVINLGGFKTTTSNEWIWTI